MKVVLSSSPVESVSLSDLGTSFVTLPMSDVVPPETVEVKTTAEAVAAFESFKDRVKETGKPAALCFFQAPRCRERKPNGFKKASGRTVYVNLKNAKVDDRRTKKPEAAAQSEAA